MEKDEIRQIAIAIYTVNRHAKTAPDNKNLYHLKKVALEKLLQKGYAKKLGYITLKIRSSVNNIRQLWFNARIFYFI